MLINIQLSQCTDVYLEFILITQIPCEFRIQAMNPLNHQQIILFQLFRSGTVLPFPGLKIKDWKIYFLSPEQLVKIDSEESSPSNAQKKPEVKQITCESKKAAANEENSSVIVNPAPEASVTEVQTPTVQDTQAETAALEPFAEKSSEESKTAASENITPVPTEQVDQATTEESAKISREVANPELQQQLVQRLNESVEKSSIHPEKLADMEMDAEIKRLASLKNKDKSDNLSEQQGFSGS